MEIAAGVHLLGGGRVNWWAIEDGGRVTLVDAGLRGQWRDLAPALAAIGRSLADVEAVLLTHAHGDHVGFAEKVRRRGARIYAHGRDEHLALGPPPRPPLSQVTGTLAWIRRPGFVRGAGFFLREGLLWPERIAEVHTFADDETVDVPGRPRVLHLPGHTPGSCALVLPDRDVIFTGDALITFDLYSGRRGPRLSAHASNEDSALARESLGRLRGLDVTSVLPGHGEPCPGGVGEAARLAAAAGAA